MARGIPHVCSDWSLWAWDRWDILNVLSGEICIEIMSKI